MGHRSGRRTHEKRSGTPTKGSGGQQRRSSSGAAEHPLVQLQREIGNAAVASLVREHREQAAMVQRLVSNRAIAQLMASDLAVVPEDSAAEREAEAHEHEGAPAGKGTTMTTLPASRSPLATGSGEALAKPVRASMEDRLGNLDQVRVHRDEDAASMSHALGAEAFTHGADVFLSRQASDRTLRHEVAHAARHTASNAVHLKRVKKHLDFLQIKKKNMKPGKALLQAVGFDVGGDTWGHWWVELGTRQGNAFSPNESYGWWPRSGAARSLGTVFKVGGSIPGILNHGEGRADPHQGHAPDEAFHPVLEVEENEAYDTVRDRVLGQVRTFASGFQGTWNWRFGWGKNCHTFVDRLKKQLHLHHQSSTRWLAGGGVGHKYTPQAIVEGVQAGTLNMRDTNWYEWAALSQAQRREILDATGWTIEEANGHMRQFGRTAIFMNSDIQQPEPTPPQVTNQLGGFGLTGVTGQQPQVGGGQAQAPRGATIRLYAMTSWAPMGQENDPGKLVIDHDAPATMGMVNLRWEHNGQEIAVRAAAVDWGNFARTHGLE